MLNFAATLLLAVLVFIAPWPVAGNMAFARFAFISVTLTTLLFAVISWGETRAERIKPTASWTWLVLLLAVLYLAIQTVDLNHIGFSQSIPHPAGVESLVDPVEGQPNSISIYPAGTRIKLVDLILAVGVFVATTLLIRRTQRVVTMMVAMVLTGTAVSFFGILQAVSWNGDLFWRYELIQGGQVFGPFVNRNNAAGFLLIPLSASIYLVAQQLFQWHEEVEAATPNLGGNVPKKRARLLRRLMAMLAKLESRHLYVTLGLITIVTGMLMTLSRGGVIALVAVLATAFLILQRGNRWLVGGAAVGTLIVVGGLLAYLEYDQKLTDRFQAAVSIELDSTPRLEHWNDMLPAANTLWGAGGGTYRYLSPNFQTFEFDKIFAHAENLYLEVLVETGWIGLIILLVAFLFCWLRSWSLLTRPDPASESRRQSVLSDHGVGLFGMTVLIGTGIASIFDFGLLQPANMILMAVAMGLVVGRAEAVASQEQRGVSDSSPPSAAKHLWGYTGWILVVLSVIWAGYYSYGVDSYRWARRTITLAKEHQDVSDPSVRKATLSKVESALSLAAAICPENAEVVAQQGELSILRFQKANAKSLTETIQEELAKPNLSPPETELWESYTPERVWASSSLKSMNRELLGALRNGDLPGFVSLLEGASGLDFLNAAHERLAVASRLRQADDLTHLRLAQLIPVIDRLPTTLTNDGNALQIAAPTGGPKSIEEYLNQVREKLSRHLSIPLKRPFPSAQTLFDCGLLEINSGNTERAAQLWAECLRKPLSGRYERPIVELSMQEMPMQLFFEQVLPQTPEQLIGVARNYFRDPQLILPKRLLLMHTERLIEKAKSELSDATYYFYLAETKRLGDQFDLAAAHFRKALDLEPDQVLWRFEYARCLRELQQFDEAIRQLQQCQLQPSSVFPKIKPLMERIRYEKRMSVKQAQSYMWKAAPFPMCLTRLCSLPRSQPLN